MCSEIQFVCVWVCERYSITMMFPAAYFKLLTFLQLQGTQVFPELQLFPFILLKYTDLHRLFTVLRYSIWQLQDIYLALQGTVLNGFQSPTCFKPVHYVDLLLVSELISTTILADSASDHTRDHV